MSSWFSRLAAFLLDLLPGRASPDPGAWILLGEGRGVSWCGEDAAGPSLTGPTPPPAR